LFGVKVPLIADEDVQKDKGTGLVMCCTFGDEQDIVWWKRHQVEYNLPMRVILNKYAKIEYCELLEDGKLTNIDGHYSQGKDDDGYDLETGIHDYQCIDINKTLEIFSKIQNLRARPST